MTKHNNPMTVVKLLNPLHCKNNIATIKLSLILIKLFTLNVIRAPLNIK
jgi:hypothetical protein